ncbi:MAG: hypothetical protein R3C19_26845 [Planctomycetaceae bacterium]
MDPVTTYFEFLKAFDSHDHDTARELAEALASSLERDGCWPERCCRTVVRACLEQVLGRKLNVPLPQLPPLFTAGRVLVADSVRTVVGDAELQSALQRHVRGDWGDADHRRVQLNETALAGRGVLQSVYDSQQAYRFKVVTEPDRSFTCVLPAEEF